MNHRKEQNGTDWEALALYYLSSLHSPWAQRKAAQYLRLLLEEEQRRQGAGAAKEEGGGGRECLP